VFTLTDNGIPYTHFGKAKKDMSKRFCLKCGSNKTYKNKKTGYENWRVYKDGFLCRNCFQKFRYYGSISIK
jgi:hypothetical protein